MGASPTSPRQVAAGRPDYLEGAGSGRFPKRSSPCCFRYLAQRLSASPTSSGDAAPKRPAARMAARTETLKGAARCLFWQRGHHIMGGSSPSRLRGIGIGRIGEGHESEAAAAARVPVGDHLGVGDLPVHRECGAQTLVARIRERSAVGARRVQAPSTIHRSPGRR